MASDGNSVINETMNPTVSIGGIKFSEQQVEFTITSENSPQERYTQLLRRVAACKINIPFYYQWSSHPASTTTFCISATESSRIAPIFQKIFARDHCHLTYREQIGIITLFPHGNNAGFLGRILAIGETYHFPVHTLCTSISSLAFTTTYSRLDEIATALQSYFTLPKNHAPFRQEFMVHQVQQ